MNPLKENFIPVIGIYFTAKNLLLRCYMCFPFISEKSEAIGVDNIYY